MSKTNKMKWLACVAAAASFAFAHTSSAALYFYDDESGDTLYSTAINWDDAGSNPGSPPGLSDLAVHNGSTLDVLTINGNWDVDSLRFSDGGIGLHTNGILTIVTNGVDTGLWIGESGPLQVTYTLDGGAIMLPDHPGTDDEFFVGKGGGSDGVLNFISGSITNEVPGVTHIGLDRNSQWNQSGGVYAGGLVHIGRFQSPNAEANLSGTATWDVNGQVLIADSSLAFANATNADLTIIGPSVSFSSIGMTVRQKGNLNFDGTGGISTLDIGSGALEIQSGELYLSNLQTPAGAGETLVLITNIGSYSMDTNFLNAPDGTTYPTADPNKYWVISNLTNHIKLTSVVGCVPASIAVQPAAFTEGMQPNSVSISVGTAGTGVSYQWQKESTPSVYTNIPAANSSALTFNPSSTNDSGNYRVEINNACSSPQLSSVAELLVHRPGVVTFWDDGGSDSLFGTALNWSTDAVPELQDLAVVNITNKCVITSDQSVDTLRLSSGGDVTQSNGTFTVYAGVGNDDGLWVGEFGPAQCTYTLQGGTIILDDAANAFDIGRNSGSLGVFNMNGGVITNNSMSDAFFLGRFGSSTGIVNMTAGTIQGPNADTHIGLDGAGEWYQSGGTFNGAGVQIGRFASPYSLAELSGTATWNVGLVLLADGHGAFSPRNPGPVDLTLIGPNVSFNSAGLVMFDEGNLTFDGTGGGLSTMELNTNLFLLTNGELFLTNLPTPSVVGEEIVLISNIGSFTGADTEFDNAPDGTVFENLWEIDYQYGATTNIVLVDARPVVTNTIAGSGSVTVQFTGASSDVPGNFQVQSAPDVTGAYADDAGFVITGSGGAYSATRAGALLADEYFRIRRQ